MPFAGKKKAPSEMTHRQLVGSLVAFTLIVAFIDTVTIVQFVRRGFSIFNVVVLVFTSIILASAYRSFLGELLRRRRAQQRPPHDTTA
jgi:uncharacterized membrane protein YwzB